MSYLDGVSPLHIVQSPPFTVDAPGYAPVEGESIPRRHPLAKDGLLERPSPEVGTTFDLISRSARLFPNEPAVGSRRLIKTHKEMKKIQKVVGGETVEVDKEWTYSELSDFNFLTYKEYEVLLLQIGAGLRKLGLSPHDKLHIFAATRLVILTYVYTQMLTVGGVSFFVCLSKTC